MERYIAFAAYVFAAITQLWPLLMFAMSTAFGGVDSEALSTNLLILALVLCMTFLAAAAASFAAMQHESVWLPIIGPIASLGVVFYMGMTVFHESNKLVLLGPQTVASLLALLTYQFIRSDRQSTARRSSVSNQQE